MEINSSPKTYVIHRGFIYFHHLNNVFMFSICKIWIFLIKYAPVWKVNDKLNKNLFEKWKITKKPFSRHYWETKLSLTKNNPF